MINAGKYKHLITINKPTKTEDSEGFPTTILTTVLKCWADVKTTKGFTLIASGTDFEKAYTNFTIRYPYKEVTRDMLILFKGKTYSIEYINNIDEANVELEIQAKEVSK